MLIVYRPHDVGEAAAVVFPRLERHTHSDDFKRVCEEDARNACHAAREESPEMCFVFGAVDYDGSNLLVREKLDGGIRENAEDCGRVAAVESYSAFVSVYRTHRGENASPGAGISRELGVGGLEEDFDSVKRRDN